MSDLISTEAGLTVDQVVDFLGTHEWYDNSRIETQDGCKRKGFYQQVGPTGVPLHKRVGQGADAGSVLHAAHEAYYTGWSVLSEERRRYNSFGVLEDTYRELFKGGASANRHSLRVMRDIWDDYCAKCLFEDPFYRPVDPEVGFIIRIAPRHGERSFNPFWYTGRADGIWERVTQRDFFTGELKSTSGGAKRRIKSLKFHRQPVGYVAMAREAIRQGRFVKGITDPMAMQGTFAIVIAVQVEKREIEREYFPLTLKRTEDWRRQTIRKVEDWRARLREHRMDPASWEEIFDQQTEECTKYGLCPYWDLCDFGVTADSINEFEPDSWNPLLGSRAMPQHTITDETFTGTIHLTR